MGSLQDLVVIITGASSGIGQAIARRCAKEGAKVVAHGRNKTRLLETQEMIESEGGAISCVVGDVTVEADCENLVAQTKSRYGTYHGLVNNAGAADRNAPLHSTSAESWDKMLDINLRAVWQLSRKVLPWMCEQRDGRIVNMSSNLGVVALGGMAAYMAAKGGLISLTRSMAMDYGANGIRVNAICPGLVVTPMTKTLPDYDEKREFYETRAALGRVGNPDDIAGLAAFLLGSDSSWITGQHWVVDGGYTIQ